jgi:hypothetical protein
MHRCVSVSVLLLCLCACGAASAQVQEDHDALGNAIAGPLVGVLSHQFGGRAVDMRLETMEVQAIDKRARTVSGRGTVHIDGQDDPVGFHFQVRYDNRLRRASNPEVWIGGAAAGERDLPNDVALVQQLETDVTGALAHQFRRPAAWLRLDRIATVEGGRRFLRINAEGVAYFGGEGRGTSVTVEAIYDRSSDAWLKLEYGLGGEAGATAAAPTIAAH